MNTKKLKQLVLDLAIHGKLVPQDPNDEPASELLKRIQTDVETRGRASNKSKGKKSAVSSVDLDEVPFEVPSSWCWTTIGELLTNRDSERKPVSSTERKKQSERIYDYYGATGVVDKVASYLFDERLLLIGEDGANLLSRAKDNAFFAEGKYWVNNHAHILDCKEKSILDYVAVVVNSMSLDDYITGSAQPKLSQDNLNKILIPLPPLAEQHRIVAAIEKWFVVIDQLEKNEADLKKSIEQTKKKVLDLAIRGKLVAQDENDEPASELLKRIKEEKVKTVKGKKVVTDVEIDEVPFELPKGWVWCRLGDVISVKSGDGIKVRDTDEGQYPIYGGNGINGFHNSFNVESQTLLIGRVGFYCGSIHKTKSKSWVTDNALIVSYETEFFCVDFLYRLLTWMNLGSTSNSTAQPVVSGKGILPLSIPLPPLAEQKRIVSKIEEVMGELDKVMEMIG